MAEGLRLIVDAETRPAINALKDLEAQARRSGAAAGQSFGAGAFRGATGLKTLTTSSNTATQSLINLGRVVQDAPFGFIGIANNLNPLLESFQRLKATTGSSGAAFSALGKSLTGPAGIGIALSVVSSLLIVFGDKLFGASKKAKELEDANKQLAESSAKDIVKLTSLVAIVQNVNAASDDRAKALKAINQEYKQYLPNLDTEKVTAENIAEAYDKITKAILRQAVIKGLQEEITKEVQKTAASIIALQRAEENRNVKSRQKVAAEKSALTPIEEANKGLQRYNKTIRDGALANLSAAQAQDAQVSSLNNFNGAMERLENELKQRLLPLFSIMENFKFEDLDIKLTGDSKKEENEIIARAKRIAADLKNIIDLELRILPQDQFKDQLQKAVEFLNKFNAGQFKFIVQLPTKVQIEDVEFPPDEVKKAAHSFEDMFSKELQKFNAGGVTDFTLIDAQTAEKQKKLIASIFGITPAGDSPFTKMQRESIAAAKAITDILTPAFQGLFSAIMSGENPIKAFFQSLGQAVQQLIAKLVQAAIQALILSALFPGGVGGVKGFGKIFGNILGFAAGGIVSGPTIAMIGEGIGTSRSNPEVVAPLDQLKGMLEGMGGGRQVVVLETRLRGRDIKLQQARTSRSQRNTVGR